MQRGSASGSRRYACAPERGHSESPSGPFANRYSWPQGHMQLPTSSGISALATRGIGRSNGRLLVPLVGGLLAVAPALCTDARRGLRLVPLHGEAPAELLQPLEEPVHL